MNELAKQDRTFFQIADDLATYFETLELAEAQLAGQPDSEDRAFIEAGRADILVNITRLGAELATKADKVAGVLSRQQTEIEAQDAEIRRRQARKKSLERAREWLKGYVMEVMRATDQRAIRTPNTTLRIQGNGGQLPVVITDPDLVPPEFCWMEGKIRADVWHKMLARLEDKMFSWEHCCYSFTRVPSSSLLLEGLKQPCECAGAGCSLCQGTCKRRIAGAHLGERGEHLRVS